MKNSGKEEISDDFISLIMDFLVVNKPIETKENALYWLQQANMPINQEAHNAINKFLSKKRKR